MNMRNTQHVVHQTEETDSDSFIFNSVTQSDSRTTQWKHFGTEHRSGRKLVCSGEGPTESRSLLTDGSLVC